MGGEDHVVQLNIVLQPKLYSAGETNICSKVQLPDLSRGDKTDLDAKAVFALHMKQRLIPGLAPTFHGMFSANHGVFSHLSGETSKNVRSSPMNYTG